MSREGGKGKRVKGMKTKREKEKEKLSEKKHKERLHLIFILEKYNLIFFVTNDLKNKFQI